ncbi:MAG: GNAT family N-acetyltransferase, partial [Candidatus Dormiibacterota bacterium]
MRFFRSAHRVEPVRPEDLDSLRGVYARAWRAAGDIVSARLLAEESVQREEIAAWLRGGFEIYRTQHDGSIVGVVRLSFPSGVCYIDRLAVDPDLWRRGHGRALLDHALSRARHAGVPRVWTQSSLRLDAARSLFDGFGFREQGRLTPRYWREPIVLLER